MSLKGPVPQPGILDIDPYVPGESTTPGGIKPIKLPNGRLLWPADSVERLTSGSPS